MTTQKKNSRLSARAIFCLMFCLLMAFTVALPSAAESVYAEAKNSVVVAEGGTLASWKWAAVLAQIISAVAVTAAALIAGRQFRANKHLESVKFVLQVFRDITSDERMQDTLRKIECYTTHQDFGVQPRDLDILLGHLASLAVAREQNVVKEDDLFVVKYYVSLTMNNPSVERHVNGHLNLMGNIHKGVQTHPYRALMKLRDSLEKKFPDKKKDEGGG